MAEKRVIDVRTGKDTFVLLVLLPPDKKLSHAFVSYKFLEFCPVLHSLFCAVH